MDDPAFATPEIDLNTQTILLHASNHDLAALKPLLRIPGNATVQDPETGYTPLHAAIAACGPATISQTLQDGARQEDGESIGEEELEKAKEVVRELFLSGAIWNDLDMQNETPGCLAWRLGRKELYDLVVAAGVRAEILLGLMGGYEELNGEDSEEETDDLEVEMALGEDDAKTEEDGGQNGQEDEVDGHTATADGELKGKRDVNSEDYLKSKLKFEDDKILDEDANGVMMAWETDIMRRSADLLLDPPNQSGKRILNIGFGMGIIDRIFRDSRPLSHHIIEAHPAVLAKLQEEASGFGQAWQDSAPKGGTNKIHAGRWQDIIPRLIEEGEIFDAIYFDTFGEDYSQLKLFFTEYVPGLLDGKGKFGFFNGLGADRRVCYDVYCKVAELDLCDAGLDVEWTDIIVEGLSAAGEGEWKGVRRRYWTLDQYRLPVSSFLG